MTDCASILLAAGASSRLGKPKQLLQIDGESLLRRCARFAAEAGCSPNIVVLGAFAGDLRPQLDGLTVEILMNPNWREGMGCSLGVAMDWLLAGTSIPEAVLLLVCDQPQVSAGLMRKLIVKQTTGESPIVASRYIRSSDSGGGNNAIVGVPAVFGSAFYPELAAVRGDQGARNIITLHASKTSYVDFPQGSFDVDTAADESLMMKRARTELHSHESAS